MKAWLSQLISDIGLLISAFPALIVFVIVIVIALILLWLWFKAPASRVSAVDAGVLKTLLIKLKGTLETFFDIISTVFDQLFRQTESQYNVPLYLVLNPLSDHSLIGSLPPSKAQRIRSVFIKDLLASDSLDRCVTLKDLNLIDVSASLSKDFQNTVAHLVKKRTQRPLDGVLVSIPISEVADKQGEELDDLINILTASLRTIDQYVPFHLPVYVVVSDCHFLQGFQAFAHQNKDQHDEIFGWSSDREFGARYRSSVIQQAFDSIAAAIQRNQVVRSCEINKLFDADDYLLVDREVSLLKPAVTTICNRLFEPDSYQNTFDFRGLYFVGRSTQDSASTQSSDTLFLSDLLEHKVAAEANFAVPTGRGIRANDDMLRRYKQLSLIALTLIVILGSWNLWSLRSQMANVLQTMETVQSPNVNGGTGYGEVYNVLEQLNKIDARSFSRLSLPISWFSSTDEQLVTRVSKQQMDGLVFPAMECRVSQRFNSILAYQPSVLFDVSTGRFEWDYAGAWLNRIDEFQDIRSSFIDLSKPARRNSKGILENFSNLIFDLYGIKPKSDFFRKNELYKQAIERVDYNVNKPNKRCPTGYSGLGAASSELFWKKIEKQALTTYKQIQNSAKLSALNISTTGQLGGSDYVKLENWMNYLSDLWIVDAKYQNPCQQMHQRLTALDSKWTYTKNDPAVTVADKAIALFDRYNCESVFYQELKQNKLAQLASLFVSAGDDSQKVAFSDAVKALRSDFGSIQTLAFMSLDHSKLPSETIKNGIWDEQRLITAIGYYRVYERYAVDNFADLALPSEIGTDRKAFILQRNMLNQLREAMLFELAWAQSKPKDTKGAFEFEEQLIKRAHNFESAVELFRQLTSIFSQLGFHAEAQSWIETTSANARDILRSADTLVRTSRLYMPQVLVDENQSNLINALYGISNENDMKRYLASQKERASFIAQNYSNAATSYLLNTDSGQIEGLGISENIWRQTLTELNKYTLKNPANSLTELEKMFMDSMSLTLDECPSELTVDAGDDIFTQSQTALMTSIIRYCKQNRESSLSKYYSEIRNDFNRNLKGRFPFSSGNPSANPTDASYLAVDNFFTKFDQYSSALKDELTEKAKKEKRYVDARDFVIQMMEVSEFLGDNLNGNRNANNLSFTIVPSFKLVSPPSIGEEQLIDQTLQSNGNKVSAPGSTSKLTWNFGADLRFSTRLANRSIYRLAGVSKSDKYDERKPIEFSESGNWALLRMVQKYRTNAPLETVSPNAGETKLMFPINIERIKKSHIEPPLVSSLIRLVVGIDIFGTNSETNQLELKTIPKTFPSNAPTL